MFWFLLAPAFANLNSLEFCVMLSGSRRRAVHVQSPDVYKAWQSGGGGGGCSTTLLFAFCIKYGDRLHIV